MKLRKTLAGILGAVVMLLGVGTFEHINRETGVHAAKEVVETVVFSKQGYTNEQVINSYKGDKFEITFNKGTASYDPAYYTSGTNMRVYNGGNMIFSSDYEITKIVITHSKSPTVTPDVGNVTSGSGLKTWSGNSKTITLSIKNDQIRMTKIVVTLNAGDEKIPLSKPIVKIDNYSGLATWGEIANAINYEYVILENNEVVKTEIIETTSVQLTDGQSIKVKAIGNGVENLDSDYSVVCTYNAIQVTTEVQSWIEPYYNDGVYTKKSEIYLNENADVDLEEVIHFDDKQPLRLNRTTYYKDNALFMSNLDGTIGGEGQINSGYRTEGSDLRHFTLNSNNEPVNDWKVSNTSLKEFFVTLDKFNGEGYFDNWKLSATEATFDVNQSNKNSETVKDFINFAAPCLEFVFTEKYENYFNLERLSITQDKNDRGQNYLSMKIYVNQTNSGALVNDKGILAESRIYSGNNVFDELATRSIPKINCENGTVTYSPVKDYYRDGEKVTFVVTPNEGYIVKSATFSGSNIPERDENGFTFVGTISANNKLVVEFGLPQQAGEPTTYIFSNYDEGTQYGKNENHSLDDKVTVFTNDCHFTTQLRIYSSSTNNGYAIIKSTTAISELGLNIGYKSDTLNVYGSNDEGETWVLISGVSFTTSYKDYTVNFNGNTYTWIKLDVKGSNQARIASITITN